MNNKITIDLSPARVEHGVASGFRLCKKLNGDLVLQGCFQWSQGTEGGFEWRDLPTVTEEAPAGEPQHAACYWDKDRNR